MSYAALAGAFLVVPAVLLVVTAAAARPAREWWLATAVTLGALLVLTVVFDSLMIAVDLFRFDESRLLGVTLVRAPLEDLAWPVAAALALPALWLLLERREKRRRPDLARPEEAP